MTMYNIVLNIIFYICDIYYGMINFTFSLVDEGVVAGGVATSRKLLS